MSSVLPHLVWAGAFVLVAGMGLFAWLRWLAGHHLKQLELIHARLDEVREQLEQRVQRLEDRAGLENLRRRA